MWTYEEAHIRTPLEIDQFRIFPTAKVYIDKTGKLTLGTLQMNGGKLIITYPETFSMENIELAGDYHIKYEPLGLDFGPGDDKQLSEFIHAVQCSSSRASTAPIS